MANTLQIKDFDEIVFEDRNKVYGAYELRKRYNRNMNIGLFIAVSFLILIVLIPTISRLLDKEDVHVTHNQIVDLTLTEPPPLNKDEPPPPPPPPEAPPPVQETIKFTAPVIVEEIVEEEEVLATMEEVSETNVGLTTQEGSGDIIDIPDGDGNALIDDGPPPPFITVEKMPEFPGGEAELYKYLSKTIKYPPMARESGITGRVFVTFVVEPNGDITGVTVLRGIGGGCDEEAVRAIKAMPKWKAGVHNGRNVRVQFNLPVTFTLR